VAALAAMLAPAARPAFAELHEEPVEWRGPPAREIPVGRAVDRGAILGPVGLPWELLSLHIAIFAGAGEGKSKNVLLSRLVEEAALCGAPSLVLDVHNDLTRLGEPWPSRPTEFSDEDARKAKAYFERVEVVVWTPGVTGGRSLTLKLLPDFAALGAAADPESLDEREQAVEMAVAVLEPYLAERGAKAIKLRGVLADGLRAFAAAGGGALDDLVRLLADLPPNASRIPGAPELAGEVADQLVAAIAADPTLRESGAAVDPAQLFTSPSGKTRISVVNLSGLGRGAAAFVNRLQMNLFGWIKANPSPIGRLYALDEAQLYAPAKETTQAKRSALALTRQARKYGLGMIFAAQEPRGLDPAIAANCLTHFYGRVGSPASIEPLKAMMAAKGGAADDLTRLKDDEFYFATEGVTPPVKIRAPMCLSRRSRNPPTTAEVAELARRRA